MPLVVLPMLMAEIEPVYDVFFEAFKDEPIVKFLYPKGVDRKAHKDGTIQWLTHDKVNYITKCVDTDTGAIVGMANWEILWLAGEENGWVKPTDIPWLEGEDKARCLAVLKPMWDLREQLFGKRRHIYLPSVAVHPDHQGAGIGKLLLQWGIDTADQLGLPIYTESSTVGYGLYERMGFERLTHVKLIHDAEVIGEPEAAEIPLMAKLHSGAKESSFQEWSEGGSA